MTESEIQEYVELLHSEKGCKAGVDVERFDDYWETECAISCGFGAVIHAGDVGRDGQTTVMWTRYKALQRRNADLEGVMRTPAQRAGQRYRSLLNEAICMVSELEVKNAVVQRVVIDGEGIGISSCDPTEVHQVITKLTLEVE